MRDYIAGRIAAGDLRPGERLPSERQLQTGGGAARGTNREGLFQLEAEGVIYRKEFKCWGQMPTVNTPEYTEWTKEARRFGIKESVGLFVGQVANAGHHALATP